MLIPAIPVGNPGFGRQESSPVLCGLSSASWIRFGVSFRQAEENCFCLLKEILMSQLTLSVNGGWEVSGICQELNSQILGWDPTGGESHRRIRIHRFLLHTLERWKVE